MDAGFIFFFLAPLTTLLWHSSTLVDGSAIEQYHFDEFTRRGGQKEACVHFQ